MAGVAVTIIAAATTSPKIREFMVRPGPCDYVNLPGRRYQIMAGGAMNEIVRAIALLLLALLPTAYSAPADAPSRPPLPCAAIFGPFTLFDQNRRTVSDRFFAGQYLFVYFGFSFC